MTEMTLRKLSVFLVSNSEGGVALETPIKQYYRDRWISWRSSNESIDWIISFQTWKDDVYFDQWYKSHEAKYPTDRIAVVYAPRSCNAPREEDQNLFFFTSFSSAHKYFSKGSNQDEIAVIIDEDVNLFNDVVNQRSSVRWVQHSIDCNRSNSKLIDISTFKNIDFSYDADLSEAIRSSVYIPRKVQNKV